MAKTTFESEIEDRKRFKEEHTYRGLHFQKLKTHPVFMRKMRGTLRAYFELGENRTIDAHVNEIPPGGCNKRHRHNNEAVIYILSGRGYSIIQKEGEPEVRIDWEEDDMLTPPLMAWHQHFNADPKRPARYLAIVTVPLLNTLGLLKIEHSAQG